MAEQLDQTIRDNAQGPSKASSEAGSMEQHKLADQIAADRYLCSKDAANSKTRGLRCTKLVPPGATSRAELVQKLHARQTDPVRAGRSRFSFPAWPLRVRQDCDRLAQITRQERKSIVCTTKTHESLPTQSHPPHQISVPSCLCEKKTMTNRPCT